MFKVSPLRGFGRRKNGGLKLRRRIRGLDFISALRRRTQGRKREEGDGEEEEEEEERWLIIAAGLF